MAGGGILAHLRIENNIKKSSKSESRENKGSQKKPNQAADSQHYQRAFDLIKKKPAGSKIGITAFRPKISTDKAIQDDVINQLISNNQLVKVKSGSGFIYKKRKPMATKVTNIFGVKAKS